MAMFLSFLGGAARQLTTDIEKAEENAREDAKLGFSALYKRYEENAKANRELTNKMSEDALWVKTTYQNATPDQINALVANPVALEALKKTDDPYKIDLSNYIKIAQGNESPAVAAERIKALPSIVGQVADNMKEKIQPTEGRSPLGGLIKDFGQTSYDTTMERMAKSQGMSLEDLQATSRVQRPTTAAKFDMAAIDKPKDLEEVKKQVELDLYNANQSGNQPAINKALENVASITATETAMSTKNKSEAEIQTQMINDIQKKQAAGDKQGAQTTIALLRQRQILEKLPKAEGQTDADKITQSNYFTLASNTRANVIAKTLPPGAFITNVDTNGNMTTVLRDLSQADLFRKGEAIAANQIIKEMAKPDGTPLSQKHKNAMMSAGIAFDDNGKAIRPAIPELPVKGAKPAAPTRGGPTPAPQTQPAPVATPSTSKPVLKYNIQTGKWE